jgi:predicted DNA-binding protein
VGAWVEAEPWEGGPLDAILEYRHTFRMTERLNARIDAELARKVRYLRNATKKSTTEVVKASIEAYFEKISQQRSAQELLADFVGSASGPIDLASNYKTDLARSLEGKARK